MGELIKAKRQAKRLSQEELGSRIGVSYQMVQKWEKGVNKPTLEQMPLLSKELDIPLLELLKGAGLKLEGSDLLGPSATTPLPYLSAAGQSLPLLVDGGLLQTNETQEVENALLIPGRQYLVLEVADMAMSPQLGKGTRVLATLVPVNQYNYEAGGVYAVSFAGRLVIRRIRTNDLRDSERLTLHSDNEAGGSITIDAGDIAAIWKVETILYQPVQ